MKSTGALLAATALSRTTSAMAAPAAGSRQILPINRGWRYKAAKVAGAETVAFDDSGFERVVIPHTNVILPWRNFDDRAYEFVSTYRRRFRLPAHEGKRVFVDFEGAMTASTVWINGHALGEYRGGFTPFSFELTPYLKPDGDNVLVVQLDSTERSDIPPFGYEIDYMTFGGIYREVSLRLVPDTFLDNIFAKPRNVLSGDPALDVDCFVAGRAGSNLSLAVELRDGERILARGTQKVSLQADAKDPNAAMDPVTSAPVFSSTETKDDPAKHTVSLSKLTGIKLWGVGPAAAVYSACSAFAERCRDRRGHTAHWISRSHIHRSWFLAQRKNRKTARARPAPDLPFCGAGHACASTA